MIYPVYKIGLQLPYLVASGKMLDLTTAQVTWITEVATSRTKPQPTKKRGLSGNTRILLETLCE
jgi:hypothetical protein